MHDALFNGMSNDLQCFRFASTYSSALPCVKTSGKRLFAMLMLFCPTQTHAAHRAYEHEPAEEIARIGIQVRLTSSIGNTSALLHDSLHLDIGKKFLLRKSSGCVELTVGVIF